MPKYKVSYLWEDAVSGKKGKYSVSSSLETDMFSYYFELISNNNNFMYVRGYSMGLVKFMSFLPV